MTTQTEALKLALEKYMAAFGQALEAYGIELQQQQIEADKFAREALANHIPDAKNMVANPAVPQGHKQEPVHQIYSDDGDFWEDVGNESTLQRFKELGAKTRTLYTTLPTQCNCSQRQCNVKPLTDEQIKKDFEKWHKENYVQGFEPYGDSYHNGHTRNRWQGWLAAHRAIESAHGIKE